MTDVVVFCAGGHARVVTSVIERQGAHRVVAVYDADPTLSHLRGYPVIHELAEAIEAASSGIVALGNNWTRQRVVQQILSLRHDYDFVSAVDPSAVMGPGVEVGRGSIVMAGAVVNVDTIIGEHCIVNTSASLDHENRLEDFVNVCPGVVTGGAVSFAQCAYLGLGSFFLQGTSVGEHSVVGQGSNVVRDIPSRVLALGNPCKQVRAIEPGEVAL